MNRKSCCAKRWLPVLSLGLLLSALAQGAQAQCPKLLYYEDLVTGLQANFTAGYVSNIQRTQNPDISCPMRLLRLTINIPAACTKAVIWTQFEGQPSGWTLNLGDSPTNNGYGGDAGTTPHNAELQILNDNLYVYPSINAPPVDILATQHLALTDGALNFVVGNQKVSWSPAYTNLDTSNLERLFAIPDTATPGEGRMIYLGLNRVVADTSRVGCGARRVLISFE